MRRARTGINSFLLYWAILSIGPLAWAYILLSSYVASLNDVVTLVSPAGCQSLVLVVDSRGVYHHGFTPGVYRDSQIRRTGQTRIMGRHFCAPYCLRARQSATLAFQLFPSYKLVYLGVAAVPIFSRLGVCFVGDSAAGAELVQSMIFRFEAPCIQRRCPKC